MGSVTLSIFLARGNISDKISKNDEISEMILLAMGSMLIFTLIEGSRVVLGAILSG